MKSENKCPVDMLSNLKCNHFMGWLYLRRAISNVVRLSFSLCRIENLLLIPFISSETVWSKILVYILLSWCLYVRAFSQRIPLKSCWLARRWRMYV